MVKKLIFYGNDIFMDTKFSNDAELQETLVIIDLCI